MSLKPCKSTICIHIYVYMYTYYTSWCILFIECTYNDSSQRGKFFFNELLATSTSWRVSGDEFRDVSKSGLKQVVLLGGLPCLPRPLAASSVDFLFWIAWGLLVLVRQDVFGAR